MMSRLLLLLLIFLLLWVISVGFMLNIGSFVLFGLLGKVFGSVVSMMELVLVCY